MTNFADYEDTHEACGFCTEGTLVRYPDHSVKCRNCGEAKAVKATASTGKRASNG